MNDPLTEKIIGCAFALHKELGAGFLEKVYENAFKTVLEESGLQVEQQHPIPVRFRGRVVGEYFADLLVNKQVLIELKAITSLAREHEIQLVHYLTATGIDVGLLINFGDSVQVKKKFRIYRPADQVGINPVNPEKIL
jgi:GxxExxY protein